MPRNLFRRVETVFPCRHSGMKEHVDEILEWFWRDNVKAKVMQPRRRLQAARDERGAPFDAQAEFVAEAQRRRKESAWQQSPRQHQQLKPAGCRFQVRQAATLEVLSPSLRSA